jgi:hypothetical protein
MDPGVNETNEKQKSIFRAGRAGPAIRVLSDLDCDFFVFNQQIKGLLRRWLQVHLAANGDAGVGEVGWVGGWVGCG